MTEKMHIKLTQDILSSAYAQKDRVLSQNNSFVVN